MFNKVKKIICNPIFILLFIIIAFRLIYYSSFNSYSTYPDTVTYISSYHGSISRFKVDIFRTPVYPTIIKIIRLLYGEANLYNSISIVQGIISLGSVVILYDALKKIFKNNKMVYAATLLYGCMPAIINYNRVILTESFSISFLVMFFCLIVEYLKNPNTKKNIFIGIYTLFLIMLRPSFIILIPILFVIWLLKFTFEKPERMRAVIGLLCLIVVCFCILGYSYLNKIQNNFFGISSVTMLNNIAIITGMDIYRTNDVKDIEIIKIIEEKTEHKQGQWYPNTVQQLIVKTEYSELIDYNKRVIKQNFSTYVAKTIDKIIGIGLKEPANAVYLRNKEGNRGKPLIKINFIFIYEYVVLEAIYVIYIWIKKREVPMLEGILLMLVGTHLVACIIGAQSEWGRLFTPVWIFMFISILLHLEKHVFSGKIVRKDT